MPYPPQVPEQLTQGPFTVSDALCAGLTRRQLQSKVWVRVSTGLYVWAGAATTPLSLLQALRGRLPARAVFSDRTAGWLHGLDLDPCGPVEVTMPPGGGHSQRAGVSIRRGVLPEADVVYRQQLRTTSPTRTAFDLARHLPLAEAVVAVDAALHCGLVQLERLRDYVAEHGDAHGRAQARQVVDLAEPRAESPMESRLRMALVLGRLPRPKAQVELTDERGCFIGRVDLLYPDERLVLEYDGVAHRDTVTADNRRQNRILAAGYRLLRFTAADVYDRSGVVVGQVRAALKG